MIVVAGEALVDLVIQPDGAVTAALGGAPFNTARAVGRLGGDVAFAGALSRDRFGSMLADQLEADGVSIADAPRTDLPTTLAAAEIDTNGSASYHFYFEATSAPQLTTLDVGVDRAGVLFTGGLGFVLQPMASTITSAVESVGDETIVVVDVNCRPTIIPDRDRYVERVERVIARSDVVKASDEDLEYLFGDADHERSTRRMADLGAGALIVTGGAVPTAIGTTSGHRTVPVAALRGAIVDTIGAGDTFDGGVLATLEAGGATRADLRGPDALDVLVPAVEAAHAAAAVVVTRRGADPPWRKDLDPNA